MTLRPINSQSYKNVIETAQPLMKTLNFTLKMTTAEVVKTTVTNNSLSEHYSHLEDHTKQTTDTSMLAQLPADYANILLIDNIVGTLVLDISFCRKETRHRGKSLHCFVALLLENLGLQGYIDGHLQ